MKTIYKFLFASTLFLLLSIALQAQQTDFNNNDNWKDNYRGKASFKLEDDAILKSIRTEYNNLSAPETRLTAEITNLKNEIQTLTDEQKVLEKKLADCRTSETVDCQTEIKTITIRLDQVKAAITEKNEQVAAKNTQSQTLAAQISAKVNQHNERRTLLITKITEYNNSGYQKGFGDGKLEGVELAAERGKFYGRRDGFDAGEIDGTREGRRQSRQEGYDEGAAIGSNEGRQKAITDGTFEGTRKGNIEAALVDGEKDGRRNAQNSDASEIGKGQGKTDGMNRAVTDGKKVGGERGEKEAVTKYENLPLKNVSEFGAFDGAFSNEIPPFPEDFRSGNKYKPTPPTGDSTLFRAAYLDGYDFGYGRETRRVYRERIEEFYDAEYRLIYDRAYTDFLNRDYRQARKDGFDEGREVAFNAVYPDIYDSYFAQFSTRFYNNPDRNSADYKNPYNDKRSEVFEKVYEEIRAENYKIAEKATFSANIEQQTEKFRNLRFAEVSEIYENYPVLKFVSGEMTDGGIGGVAKNDGIFQPDETTYQSVTLINFGKRAAVGTNITTKNGKTITIDSIAPQTKTTIKNVSSGKISENARVSEIFEEILTVRSTLSADKTVQGRYFENANENVLARGKISVNVQYPLSISGVKLTNILMFNQKNQLTATVKNDSKIDYAGQMTFELSDNASSKTVAKNFNAINNLTRNQPQTISGAEVIVSDLNDTYNPLNFSVKILKDGVVVGKYENFTAMAKSPFQQKGNESAVIITDGSNADGELFEAIRNLGGREKVSILDLSLSEENKELWNTGIVGKTVVILENADSNVAAKANSILANSSQSVFLFVNKNGANNPELVKNASSFPVRLTKYGAAEIYLTNPLISKETKDSQIVIRTDSANLKQSRELADVFRLSADDHLAKIKEAFDRHGYFNPTDEQKILAETFNIKMLSEILNIDSTYRSNGKNDNKILMPIKTDQNLLINKLFSMVSQTPITNETLGIHLFAVNAIYTLDKAMNKFQPIKQNFSGKTESYVDDVRKAMEKKFEKILKNDFRAIYDKVYQNESAFTPFEIAN